MTQDTEPDAIEAEKRRTADEQDLIEMLERLEGRKFTEQEINLSLDQARRLFRAVNGPLRTVPREQFACLRADPTENGPMLPGGFPKTMPGKRVCKKPLRHRLISAR